MKMPKESRFTLTVLGNETSLRGPVNNDVLVAIDEVTRYKPEGIQFTDRYRDKSQEWDGYIRLFRNMRFPTGLLQRVVAVMEILGVDYEVADKRRKPASHPFPAHIDLRDYQEPIVEAAIQRGSGLIPVSVGGGKTIIGAEIISRLGVKTMVIVPSEVILEQTVSNYQTVFDKKVGIIKGKVIDPRGITVVLWQKINAMLKHDRKRILDILDGVGLLIMDEVHHVGADAVFDVAMYCPAYHRYGLSGTMFRTDGQDLKIDAAFGDLLPGITASDLIRKGYLVLPDIEFVRTVGRPYGYHSRYQTIYREMVVENVDRNRLLALRAQDLIAEGRKTLILVSHVQHGHVLDQLIPEAEFVHSMAKSKADTIKRFREGDLNALISTPIFDEGVDIPEIEGIVLAGAGKSQIKATQRVGRGLRICPEIGKKDVKVIETTDPVKYLYEHSLERSLMYKMENEYKVRGDMPT